MDIKLSCYGCDQHVVVDSSAGGSTVNCPRRFIALGAFKALFAFFILLPLAMLFLLFGIGTCGYQAAKKTETEKSRFSNTELWLLNVNSVHLAEQERVWKAEGVNTAVTNQPGPIHTP